MNFNFRQKLSPQKNVRLFVGDSEAIEMIAIEQSVTQDEAIRTLLNGAIAEYKGKYNLPDKE